IGAPAKTKDCHPIFTGGPNTTPLLTGKHKFIVGMANFKVTDAVSHQRITEHINGLINSKKD
ncbi:MAG: hypothetical protein AAFX53_16550, partial [Bacteroidota bacterium]